jgi:hypothetical protein
VSTHVTRNHLRSWVPSRVSSTRASTRGPQHCAFRQPCRKARVGWQKPALTIISRIDPGHTSHSFSFQPVRLYSSPLKPSSRANQRPARPVLALRHGTVDPLCSPKVGFTRRKRGESTGNGGTLAPRILSSPHGRHCYLPSSHGPAPPR